VAVGGDLDQVRVISRLPGLWCRHSCLLTLRCKIDREVADDIGAGDAPTTVRLCLQARGQWFQPTRAHEGPRLTRRRDLQA
jgi:hypothetical protein